MNEMSGLVGWTPLPRTKSSAQHLTPCGVHDGANAMLMSPLEEIPLEEEALTPRDGDSEDEGAWSPEV